MMRLAGTPCVRRQCGEVVRGSAAATSLAEPTGAMMFSTGAALRS